MANLGKRTRLYFMSKNEIEKSFPSLQSGGYSITSPATIDYNCIAWAANDTEVWWEPDLLDLSYWPPGVPRTYTIDAYVEAYKTLGYSACEDAENENDFEKIAIYADSNEKPTHAARQLNSGKWTSKLGRLEDIEHHTLDSLTGPHYGSLAVILKRPNKK